MSFTHSGANLSTEYKSHFAPIRLPDPGVPPGDLNAELSTTFQQIACASEDPKLIQAGIVLVDGCINDMSALAIALPFPFNGGKADEIRTRVYQQCSNRMEQLIESTKENVARATIIESGYWRIISDKSSPFGVAFMKSEKDATLEEIAMQKEFQDLIDTQRQADKMTGQQPKDSDSLADAQALFQKWSENSKVFFQTTEKCFQWAVRVADTTTPLTLTTKGDHCPPGRDVPVKRVSKDVRAFLAIVPDNPKYAYGTGSATHLWSVPIAKRRQDELFQERGTLCKTHYKKNAGEQFVCRVNATAHPNIAGARAFAERINDILHIAWKSP